MDTTKSTKFLYQPLSPFHLNQGFAANLPCVEVNNSIPLDKRRIITGADNFVCPIGYEKLYPKLGMPKGHTGLDLQAAHGQPIYAACEGQVWEMQTEAARGLGLGIVTENKYLCNETNNEEYFKVRYWHLLSFNVKLNDRVKKGDLIGYADNTGFSSGDHCHFEIKPVRDQVGFVNILQNNGFFGAVDPLQYIIPEFANTIVLPPVSPQPQLKDYPTYLAWLSAFYTWYKNKLLGK